MHFQHKIVFYLISFVFKVYICVRVCVFSVQQRIELKIKRMFRETFKSFSFLFGLFFFAHLFILYNFILLLKIYVYSSKNGDSNKC